MPSANHNPLYIGIMKDKQGLLSAANVNRDGTGTMVDLFVADTVNGSFVGAFKWQNAGPIGGAPAANVIRLWIKKGGTYRALPGGEIAVTGLPAPTATVPGETGTVTVNQDLEAGEALAASLHAHASSDDDYHIIATGGDYSVG